MERSEQIKKDIADRGLTRKAYAELMGVETDTVYKWLSGAIKPSKQTLKLMRLSTEQLRELAADEKTTA